MVQRGVRLGRCRLRASQTSAQQRLSGLTSVESTNNTVSLSAYADDVIVFIKGQNDIETLGQTLALYEQASSVKVNWSKYDGLILGEWCNKEQLGCRGAERKWRF